MVNSNLQCSLEDRGVANRLEESDHYPNPQERQQKSLQELQRDQSAECAGKSVWEDLK